MVIMNYESFYYGFLLGLIIIGLCVFIALQFVTPAYGMTYNNRWGMSMNSRIGWIVMELPVFIFMILIYVISMKYQIRPFNIVTFIIFIFFECHYLQRSLIFPLMMKGRSRMPISIVVMGIVFNTSNAYMQGGWLFFYSPVDAYPISWLWSPQFIIGTILFFTGMIINIQSDKVIRNLRTSREDNNYYLPKKFLFKYINSSNYFGEILEWIGFAILIWSISGVVFLFWSIANIIPRAKAVYERYTQFFGPEFISLKRWKLFPFIY